ncbi:hypothetical protein [Clavibacter sp. Sh2126]|uniref:hypothetical protein n=1 Tax=Clavibacter sp. Sh2126 TaxID=3397678 RepID=UPI0039DF2D6A
MHERPSDAPRRRRAAAAALLVALSVTALGGCAPSETPDPTPAPAPSLTQEQQDDAAFLNVMTEYVDLDPNTLTDDDLEKLLTGNLLQGEKSGLQDSRKNGERSDGLVVMSGFAVTDRGLDPEGLQYMTAQACLDSSGTHVRDSAGNEIKPARDARLSLQIKAVKTPDASWQISDIVRNESVRACG